MTDDEALDEIERWFASLEETKRKTKELAELQSLAKIQPDEARRKLKQLDSQPQMSYSAERLGPAVHHIVAQYRQLKENEKC